MKIPSHCVIQTQTINNTMHKTQYWMFACRLACMWNTNKRISMFYIGAVQKQKRWCSASYKKYADKDWIIKTVRITLALFFGFFGCCDSMDETLLFTFRIGISINLQQWLCALFFVHEQHRFRWQLWIVVMFVRHIFQSVISTISSILLCVLMFSVDIRMVWHIWTKQHVMPSWMDEMRWVKKKCTFTLHRYFVRRIDLHTLHTRCEWSLAPYNSAFRIQIQCIETEYVWKFSWSNKRFIYVQIDFSTSFQEVSVCSSMDMLMRILFIVLICSIRRCSQNCVCSCERGGRREVEKA